MKKSNLLINEPPLQVSPTLAASIGLHEAIVIQQLHYWICNPKCKGEVDPAGNKWVYNTYEEWQEGNFPFWSIPTIQRVFLNLEKMGVIVSAQLNSKRRDMRKYYRIAYDQLDALDDINLMQSNESNRCDVNNESETTTETTTETTKRDSEIFAALESLTGSLNSNTPKFVDTWLEKHEPARILEAITEAKERRARSVKYVDEILISWEANGYPKTREQKVDERKNKPSSTEKVFKVDDVDEEEVDTEAIAKKNAELKAHIAEMERQARERKKQREAQK